MDLYVIYTSKNEDRHPCYIVRRWVGETPAPEPLGSAYTMETARKLLPPGLTKARRFRNDDPAIMEIWI